MDKVALVKMIRLMQEGRLPLEAGAKASIDLGLKPRTIRYLGHGGEGLAHLMTSPTHGVQVSKTYNIKGPYYSPKLIEDKARVWRRGKDSGFFAEYYGTHPTKPITYHEYVPNAPSTLNLEDRAFIERQYGITDVMHKPQNVHGNKVIDFLPYEADEFVSRPRRHLDLAERSRMKALVKHKKGVMTEERKNHIVSTSDALISKLKKKLLNTDTEFYAPETHTDILRMAHR